jgi:hypothetical protein
MSLYECLARFAWPSRHIDYLEAELAPRERAYRDARILPDIQKGGRVIEYTLHGGLPPVPAEIGLRVGDCAHNLCATLDDLAFTIAAENDPALSSEQRRAVAFPICL